MRHIHLDLSTPKPCFRALNDLACLLDATKRYKKGDRFIFYRKINLSPFWRRLPSLVEDGLSLLPAENAVLIADLSVLDINELLLVEFRYLRQNLLLVDLLPLRCLHEQRVVENLF